MHKVRKYSLRLTVILAMALTALWQSCSEIDYQLYHTSYCMMRFYNENGDSIAISDSLQITAEGTDAVLVTYAQGYGRKTISLPLSYSKNKDVFKFSFKNGSKVDEVNVTVTHDNWLHFENMDNQPCAYHMITDIEVEPLDKQIRKATITKGEVTFDRTENIHFEYEDINAD